MELSPIDRLLGGGGGEVINDYTILHVAVYTLWLIILVDTVREFLDRLSVGKPFFKTVLEGIYREYRMKEKIFGSSFLVTTLGLVEFFLLMLGTYTNLNFPTFGKVHLALTVSALMETLQSIVLGFFVRRLSTIYWVETEYQDLHHYVEIREEFDKVEQSLAKMKTEDRKLTRSYERQDSSMSDAERLWPSNKGADHRFFLQLRRLWRFIVRSVRYPNVMRRHNKLLMQLRFHELKFHFIKSNKLPITLEVSDYLKRSELHILQHLVHIPTFAWLILTLILDLLYFLMGVVLYSTDGSNQVGKMVPSILSIIFVATNIFFVILSLLIWKKMEWIFRKIMRKKPEVNSDFDQKSLFWFGEPKYITVLIQFMQFGFSVSWGIIIIFGVSFQPLQNKVFVPCVALCNILYIFIMCHVLTKFTVTSSLGQLVNKRLVNEALARYKLKSARREYERMKNEKKVEDTLASFEVDPLTTTLETPADEIKPPKRRYRRTKTKSDGVLAMRFVTKEKGEKNVDDALLETSDQRGKASISNEGTKTRIFSSIEQKVSSKDEQKTARRKRRKALSDAGSIKMMREATLLEELVTTNTKELRDKLPEEEKKKLSASNTGLKIKGQRHRRTKTLSDGVLAMREMATAEETKSNEASFNSDERQVNNSQKQSRKHSRRRLRHKSVSASASIQMMQNMSENEEDRNVKDLSENIEIQKLPTLTEGVRLSSKSFITSEGGNVCEDGKAAVEAVNFDGMPEEKINERTIIHSRNQIKFETDEANKNGTKISQNESIDVDRTEIDSLNDGNCSDFEDLPAVSAAEEIHRMKESAPKKLISNHLRTFFLGRKYVILSLVLTMACFLLVSKRLEFYLTDMGLIYEDSDPIPAEDQVFWALFTFLLLFILVDFLVIFLFRPPKNNSDRERLVFTSAILDFIICSICFGLLVASQLVNLCCDEDDYRLLGGEEIPASEEIRCCGKFGQILSNPEIEMGISILAFRLIRFWVAGTIVSNLDKVIKRDTSEEEKGDNQATTTLPFDPLYEMHGSEDEAHLTGESGSIVELWEAAIGIYPNIVEKHGAFSGELLQAMLGIPLLESAETETSSSQLGMKNEVKINTPSEALSVTRTKSVVQTEPGQTPLPGVATFDTDTSSPRVKSNLEICQRELLSGNTKYAKLTPQTKSIILAGRRGDTRIGKGGHRSTQSCGNLPILSLGERDTLSKIHTGLIFDADHDAPVLLVPDARLVRNMRRCDHKILPLLDKWTTVDVVMTKYEIVYFDVNDIDNLQDKREIVDYTKNIRQALMATKGGKGLRLSDVAFGRKIIGQLSLEDIQAVTIERILPRAPDEENQTNELTMPTPDEYWKELTIDRGQSCCTMDESKPIQPKPVKSRYNRWMDVNEDRLTLKTKHDTLFLRFYSDLDHAEHNLEKLIEENNQNGPVVNNNSILWCQTIGRLVGATKLDQELPHFGEMNDDELRDYIIITEHEDTKTNERNLLNTMRQLGHRRGRSSTVIATGTPRGIRRSSTFGALSTNNDII